MTTHSSTLNIAAADPRCVVGRDASANLICNLLNKATGAGYGIANRNWRVIGPLSLRQNSVLFRAQRNEPRQDLLVKVCTQFAGEAVQEAQRQFEALRRVADAMAGDEFLGVVRPYSYLLENGCLVTDWVEGTSLHAVLRDWRLPLARLREKLALAGRWLRCFHDAHSDGTGFLDTAQSLSALEDSFSAMQGRFIDRSVVRAARAFLEAGQGVVGSVTLRRGWHHGDFKPENLLLADGRAIGFDFEMLWIAECLKDIVNFLVHLDLTLLYPSSLHRWAFRSELRAAFFNGYGVSELAAAAPVLKWLEVLRLLRAWADQEAVHRGPSMWYLRWGYRHLLAALMADS